MRRPTHLPAAFTREPIAKTSLDRPLRDDEYPRLVFGQGGRKTVQYLPDKLPIGIERNNGWYRHAFVYLVRQNVPSERRFDGYSP